jgi:predicted transport protein
MSLNVDYKVKNSLKGTKEETQRIFEELRKRVLGFGTDVKERATRYEVRFERNHVFMSVRVNKKNIKAWIRVNPKTFSDPKKIVKLMKWSPPHFFYINSMEELEYAISLIKQAYLCSK